MFLMEVRDMLISNFKLRIFIIVFLMTINSKASSSTQVSLINLISTPDRYEKVEIEAKGFLQFDGELLLYVDQDRAKNVDFMSAVLVQDKSTKNNLVEGCGGKYVSINGEVFVRSGRASIENVSKIFSLGDSSICWKPGGFEADS